jgi:hypothetical protein
MPATGEEVLFHVHESAVQKTVGAAARAAGIDKRARCPRSGTASPPISWRRAPTSAPSRRCSATRNVRTTMIYTHIVDRGPLGVVSPLDR